MITGFRWWEWVLMLIAAFIFGWVLGAVVPLGSA